MAKQFFCKVDFEDGSAEGVHFETTGTEKTIEHECSRRIGSGVHFQEGDDGPDSGLIFISADHAANEKPHIGTFKLIAE